MSNAKFTLPEPKNEPILSYAPGTEERVLLKEALDKLSGEQLEIPLIIGGREIKTGNIGKCVMPHDHKHVLAVYHKAGKKEVLLFTTRLAKKRFRWQLMLPGKHGKYGPGCPGGKEPVYSGKWRNCSRVRGGIRLMRQPCLIRVKMCFRRRLIPHVS